jgi:uncharacterized protein YgiM (DUF1202 family)
MLALAQAALAAETFRTTEGVNFRSGPSTESNIITTVGIGSSVEVLQHDPAGWSRVRINGSDGYIRSDFLELPIGNDPANFRTTTGVNLRAGPSTDENVVTTIGPGVNVEILEHDPAGWSNARINGTSGFIRSDFLLRPIQNVLQPVSEPEPEIAPSQQSQSQTPTFFRTTDGVNFRAGPSTDADILNTAGAGTRVEMLEHNPNGWSKVRLNGAVGYIRSDFLTAGGGGVELLYWSEARNVIRNGVPMRVVDVRTGISFNLISFSKGGHADVEPPTIEDTEAIFRSRNGVWAWAPRPVWVTIGDRTIAAALNGMPHAGSTIATNGMNGHLCLHFNGTVTNSQSYQRSLNNAVIEAWNAAQ